MHQPRGIDGDHPVGQVAQHGIQALLLDLRLAPAAADGQGVVQGPAHRVGVERQHPLDAGLFRDLDGGRGADYHPETIVHQPADLLACLLEAGVGGLADIDCEQRRHGLQFGVRVLEADDADLGGPGPGQVEGADQVVFAHADRED
ncbi:hypothetical protein D9M71_373350 [compost metagenome]